MTDTHTDRQAYSRVRICKHLGVAIKCIFRVDLRAESFQVTALEQSLEQERAVLCPLSPHHIRSVTPGSPPLPPTTIFYSVPGCTCLPMMRENLQVSERFFVVLDKQCNKPKSPSFSSTMTPAIQFHLFPAIGKGFLFEYILKMLLSAVRVFDGSYRAGEDCFVGWWKRSLPTKIGTRRSYTCLAPSTKGGRAE